MSLSLLDETYFLHFSMFACAFSFEIVMESIQNNCFDRYLVSSAVCAVNFGVRMDVILSFGSVFPPSQIVRSTEKNVICWSVKSHCFQSSVSPFLKCWCKCKHLIGVVTFADGFELDLSIINFVSGEELTEEVASYLENKFWLAISQVGWK